MSRRSKSPKIPPAHAPSAPPIRPPQRRIRPTLAAGGAAGLALAALLLYFLWPHTKPREELDLGEDFVEDPRLTYATPFRNVRPDVKYLGDAACASCHRDKDRTFHQHPMGRSMAPIAVVAPMQHEEPATYNPFEALGAQYRVERQGGRVFHKEIRKDAQGTTLTETQAEISHVLGSGVHAQTYLLMRGEQVFQSPITWFHDKHRWNLSPGYERVEDRFERPVQVECLFCHCNHVELVKDTLNSFTMPLFPRGEAIGCERCHGPGELHVRERRERLPIPEDGDDTIVNPAHLAPALREAVCQQCHLEADRRILRRGREAFDYRPGLPLHLFWSDFLRPPDLNEHGKFVGKVEQMHASRCFIRSKGKLSCSTCHNAHVLPASEKKTAYYRQQCVNCHQKKGCSLPQEERQAREDNCVACHMPRVNSTDISHTAIIDHRIARRPEKSPAPPVPRQLQPGEVPLVHFHKDQVEPGDKEVERDQGLALVVMARLPTPLAKQLCDTAFPYLESALLRGPRDAAALQGKAFVLSQRGQYRQALEVVQKVLARSPRHELALADAGYYAEQAGDLEKALDYSRRLIAVNPWLTRYRLLHGRVLIRHKEYDKAISECREVLTFNPASVKIRSLLVSCYLKTGKLARAREEFDILLKLNPPNKEELRQWFADQVRY